MAKRLNGEIIRPAFVLIVGSLALLVVYLVPRFLIKRLDGKATGVVLSRRPIQPLTGEKIKKGIVPPLPREIKRDPFLPSYMRLEARTSDVYTCEELGFSLSGIVWDPKNPVAIINGEVMHVGDSVDGKKILEIKKDRVILGEGEARYTVILWEK
jgi:hypothetical protein